MSNGRSTDPFLCPVCLDVFNDPVTTSCGHNFCKNCITRYWDSSVLYQCPMCKEIFNTRPQLQVNTFIRDMADDFRREVQQRLSRLDQQAAKPGEVACDVCTGTKLKALKTCLVCLASYCETHLEPHLTASRLKMHQLMEPVLNVEDRMCAKHNKPLELFCKTDETCACSHCPVLDHKNHIFVPLTEGSTEKKVMLAKIKADLQQMIQMRQQKIQEITGSFKIGEDGTNRENMEGIQVFTDLKMFAERGLTELQQETQKKQKTLKNQASGHITELQQEIYKLMKRGSEIEQLICSGDHLTILQGFPSLKDPPPTKNWTQITVHPPSYEGTVVRAMTRALDHLQNTLKEKMKKLVEAELRRVRQSAVGVTLDANTAHPWLVLSDDRKQVHCGNLGKKLQDNPKRFSTCACVLGEQSFSSGRFYFEVQVEGKTEWDLGVARESANRKGDIVVRPQFGYWVIRLRNTYECKALTNFPVSLSVWPLPRKVGVFVYYEEGLVSFYDVEAAVLLYSFTGCSFAGKIHPFFFCGLNNDGANSAPLVICPGSPNCGGSRAQRSVDRQCAAGGASEKLMEEEVTEPDTRALEPPGMLRPGTHSEVNGDLPGNPYLRDGAVDEMESPAREPEVLQYPAECNQSQQCG
ncbi:E3 ubiquitin-protein ligase TRIM21-like [Xenentodon cancila]